MNSDFCLCTINSCDFTVYALKKRNNVERRRAKRAIQTGTKYLLCKYYSKSIRLRFVYFAKIENFLLKVL